jgi:hypothetical protein
MHTNEVYIVFWQVVAYMRSLKTLVKAVQKTPMMNVNIVMDVRMPTKSQYQLIKMNHLGMQFQPIRVIIFFHQFQMILIKDCMFKYVIK